MGYLIHWDNEEKTVVFQQYTGNPVKDDLYHLAEESALMLNSVPHIVHLIIDERTIKLTLSSTDINGEPKTDSNDLSGGRGTPRPYIIRIHFHLPISCYDLTYALSIKIRFSI